MIAFLGNSPFINVYNPLRGILVVVLFEIDVLQFKPFLLVIIFTILLFSSSSLIRKFLKSGSFDEA